MDKTSLQYIRWRRVLMLGAVALALGSMVGGSNSPTAAQTAKKTDPPKQAVAPKKLDQSKKAEPKLFNDQLVTPASDAEQVAFINAQIAKVWDANKITPSLRCTDHEFIRRASLDIIGRIAKPDEIERFLRDPANKRRSMLIERLLETEEYANHFGNVWTNLLLTRSAGKVYHDQMHLWLFEHFEKDEGWDKIVRGLLTARGRTNENGAVNFILHHLGEAIPGNPVQNGKFEMVPVTSRTTRLFLGIRTQCTQCHDHPFNDEWQQKHFWGVNAFFRQVDAPSGRPIIAGNNPKKMAKVASQFVLEDNARFNTEAIVPYERRNALIQFQKPEFLDGSKLPASATNRREELAKLVIANPSFAKAFINRMWGHFFGRGFTKDVDDFGEHSPVSHPELLDKLAKDWSSKFQHNPKLLIRWICNSRAYGLSSVSNPTNDQPDAEPFFGRMQLKAMSPEQLFESLMIATNAKAGQDKQERTALRERWLQRLIVNFGDDEGSEGTFNGTVVQALLMMNGQEINTAILDTKTGTVASILSKRGVTQRSAVQELYLATLNRPPTEAEYNRILNPKMYTLPRLANPTQNPAYWTAFYQDLLWALLNSNEFILNH